VVGEQPDEVEAALLNYGKFLGTAFQLTDDVMDYSSTSQEMGKSVGDDLSEGKVTLPLIYAMKNGSAEQSALIKKAITSDDDSDYFDEVKLALNETNALGYAHERSLEEADKAIKSITILPENQYKRALIALAQLAAKRVS
ncbi:MAG: polyprenyl synthetase family protein, partial [Thiotrichaceae bacterium]|nr:polyprenyl synthetase family protein [Thiotrichaceae bacterium]